MTGETTALDEFVQQITSQLKAEEKQTRKAAGRDGLALEIIQAQAPQGWAKLREWVKKFCEKSNRELGEEMFVFDVTPHWQLRVATKAPKGKMRTLEAHFNQELKNIAYSVGNKTGEFTPHYAGNGKIEFTDGNKPSSIDRMGKTMIGALLEIPQ